MTPGKKLETMIQDKLNFAKTDIKSPQRIMASSLPPNMERAKDSMTAMSKKSSIHSGVEPIHASVYESTKYDDEALNERHSISSIKKGTGVFK